MDDRQASKPATSFLLTAGGLFLAWLVGAGFIINLMASGRSDLGTLGDGVVIAAMLVATVYIARVLWQRRPST